MEISILTKTENVTTINLSPNIFNLKYNENLVHQLIFSYLNNSHQRIKKQKSRGLVSGGGKKPWKQKGTGRARVGSIRSPLWKGGGKIFAAKGEPLVKKKINKKVYKLGIKIIFSELLRTNRLYLINDLSIYNHKTKEFLQNISYLNIKKPSLFIFKNIDLHLNLASRNLKYIKLISYNQINPIILLKFKFIYITISAIKLIEEYFK